MTFDEATGMVKAKLTGSFLFRKVYHSATTANMRDTTQKIVNIKAIGPELEDGMYNSTGVSITERDLEGPGAIDALFVRVDRAVDIYKRNADKE